VTIASWVEDREEVLYLNISEKVRNSLANYLAIKEDLQNEGKQLQCVTKDMAEAGNKIATELVNAELLKSTNGIAEFKDSYRGEYSDIIGQYLAGEIDSVTAIYIAMSNINITQ